MKPKLTPKPKLPLLTYAVDKVAVALIFLFSQFSGYAYPATEAMFPPGLISTTPVHKPWALKGMKIYADEPLKFDFLLDEGDAALSEEELKKESRILIEYFLACLTLPEDELWVNLSPYEKDKIIPEETGLTEMGKGLLEQDYLLKKLTASLMYPETDLGKEFWQKVYQRAYQLFKTTKLPVNTFNKVWIIPDKAVVYEDGDRVVIGESHLKVMLESDYLALKNSPSFDFAQDRQSTVHSPQTKTKLSQEDTKEINDFSSSIVKEVIIPAIEEEVNTGKNFAALRQMYSSFILATWFKKRLKQSLLGQAYVDQKKVSGIDTNDPSLKESIYQQYLSSYKDGIYNYIKSDYSTYERKNIKRRYYSGGITITSSPLGIVPGISRWVGKIVTAPLSLIKKREPALTGQEQIPIPNIRKFSEEETQIVYLQEDNMPEFKRIVKEMISRLYDLRQEYPDLYNKLGEKVKKDQTIELLPEDVRALELKRLPIRSLGHTQDNPHVHVVKVPSILQKIILALKQSKEKDADLTLLLQSSMHSREEVIPALLAKITTGRTLSLPEAATSYVLEKVKKKTIPYIEDVDREYLKRTWAFSGNPEDFIEYVKSVLKVYLESGNDDAFLPGTPLETKDWLLRQYLIPLKLFLEYTPYLDLTPSAKTDLFFQKYMAAFLKGIDSYISKPDNNEAYFQDDDELEIFFNEQLLKIIPQRADRLVLGMLKRDEGAIPRRQSIHNIIASHIYLKELPGEAQELIIEYIQLRMSEKDLRLKLAGIDLLSVKTFLSDLERDYDLPSLRQAVNIASNYGLGHEVVNPLARIFFKKDKEKKEEKEGKKKSILDEDNESFRDLRRITQKVLTPPQLRLLIEEAPARAASSALNNTPGGIDFLDEKFFKLETQGKGMDISYDPAEPQDFDLSGLRIGEILIANPKKN